MGKKLIIKGADFSDNALEQGTVEPTVFCTLKGVGTSNSFSNGDYYINPNYPNYISHKNAQGNVVDVTESQFVKYVDKSYYMYFDNDAQPMKFRPAYGLEELEAEEDAAGYLGVNNGNITVDTTSSGSAYKHKKYLIQPGDSVVWASKGGSKCTAAVVEDGVARVIATNNCFAKDIYTNNNDSEVTLYLNYLIENSPYGWVAAVL